MTPIVQREVNTFVDVVWNSHRIREQKNTFLPDGVPNHIYDFPDKYGLEECASGATPIYAVAGQPMVHLPCILEEVGTAALNAEVESAWAQYNGSRYILLIASDKYGTKEKFIQPIIGADAIYSRAGKINQQFYGRVNVSASQGLIINNVQSSDAGEFLCLYREAMSQRSTEVELIVFNNIPTSKPCPTTSESVKESFDCGKRRPRSKIAGGNNTTPGAWPWQVSLKHRYEEHLCGGSVIGPRWILTAAHCFDYFDVTDFTIIAGVHHLSTADGFEQEVAIERFFKHPRYNLTCRYNNDVALLKLNRTLKYNNRVGPVCLPDSEFASGSICHITGWGTTGLGAKSLSKTLKQATLPLVPRDTCKRSYRDFRSLGYCVTKRMRCAGYARGGVDACKGDSGGPLVCHRNRKWYLMGVVSWGAGCGLVGRYGVYSDVLKLKKWIQETIQDA